MISFRVESIAIKRDHYEQGRMSSVDFRIKSVHYCCFLFVCFFWGGCLFVFCFVFWWGVFFGRVMQYIVTMRKKREILFDFCLAEKNIKTYEIDFSN